VLLQRAAYSAGARRHSPERSLQGGRISRLMRLSHAVSTTCSTDQGPGARSIGEVSSTASSQTRQEVRN
jgi:hypothetical protein